MISASPMGRWLSLARKVLESNFGTLKAPYKMTYVVTKDCQSRCANCDIWRSPPRDELSVAELTAFARQSPFLSWIDFTGGEPTDRPDLPEVIATFLKHCPDLLFVRVPTNGLRPEEITATFRRILGERPPVFVASVSIDGPPKLNDSLRGVKGGFALATETLRRLRTLPGLHVYASMTLFPQNAHLIDETIEAIRERVPGFGARDLHLNLGQTSAHYYGNDAEKAPPPNGARPPHPSPSVSPSGSDFGPSLIQFMERQGFPRSPFLFLDRLFQKRALEFLRTRATPMDCSALLSSFYLSETGVVYPCTIWDRPLGNIRETGYAVLPLIRSNAARTLRGELLRKSCANCWTPCEAYPTLAANLWRPSRE